MTKENNHIMNKTPLPKKTKLKYSGAFVDYKSKQSQKLLIKGDDNFTTATKTLIKKFA